MPSLSGKTIVFTGALSMTRNEATAIAINAGARVSGTLSSATDYLVVGPGAGQKLDQARRLRILAIREAEFLGMAKAKTLTEYIQTLRKPRRVLESKAPTKIVLPIFSAPDIDLD